MAMSFAGNGTVLGLFLGIVSLLLPGCLRTTRVAVGSIQGGRVERESTVSAQMQLDETLVMWAMSKQHTLGVVMWAMSKQHTLGVVMWAMSKQHTLGVVMWAMSKQNTLGVVAMLNPHKRLLACF